MNHQTPAEVACREIHYSQGRPLKIIGARAYRLDGEVRVVVEVLERWHGGEAVVCHVATTRTADGAAEKPKVMASDE